MLRNDVVEIENDRNATQLVYGEVFDSLAHEEEKHRGLCEKINARVEQTIDALVEKSSRTRKTSLAFMFFMSDENNPYSPITSDFNISENVDYNTRLLYLFYMTIGFYLSAPGMAVQYFCKEELGFDQSTAPAVMAFAALPWAFKIGFGFISDNFPIMRRHRAPYIILTSGTAVTVHVYLFLELTSQISGFTFRLVLLTLQCCICFSDVMADSLLAERAREEMTRCSEQGDVERSVTQERCIMMREIGQFLGSCTGMILAASLHDYNLIFGMLGVAPLAIFLGAFFVSEFEQYAPIVRNARAHNYESETVAPNPYRLCDFSLNVFKRARNAIHLNANTKNIAIFALFLFAAGIFPSSGTALQYFLMDELRFTRWFMGILSLLPNISAVIGVLVYSRYFYKYSVRTLVCSGLLIVTVIGIMPIILVKRWNHTSWFQIDDGFFVLGDDALESFASCLIRVPILRQVAKLCPAGSEGVVYSGFTSIANATAILSGFVTSATMRIFGLNGNNYSNLAVYILFCLCCNVFPFVVSLYIPRDGTIKERVTEDECEVVEAGVRTK
jgi:Na+/melibiose symporter-like transporter